MSNIQMDLIESSTIYSRGHDAQQQVMHIRFKDTKSGTPLALYEYGNISPEFYAQGCAHISDRTGELSFGQWFQKNIRPKANQYPYRKIEDAPAQQADDFYAVKPAAKAAATTTDFASGQPIPATTAEPEIIIPSDPEELKKAALDLQQQASVIVINSTAACDTAMRVGIAIARMRDALEVTLRPAIKEKHEAWKAELAVLNFYDQPLESHQNALRKGISVFRLEEQRKAQAEAGRIRAEQQRQADEEARKRSEELKLADAIEAEQRGEPELAQIIMEAPALPMAPAYVPPVHVPTAIPTVKGASHREAWTFEYVDEKGNTVDAPRLDLIPKEYIITTVNEAAIKSVAKVMKKNTNIPGIRVYDAGNVAFSKK